MAAESFPTHGRRFRHNRGAGNRLGDETVGRIRMSLRTRSPAGESRLSLADLYARVVAHPDAAGIFHVNDEADDSSNDDAD